MKLFFCAFPQNWLLANLDDWAYRLLSLPVLKKVATDCHVGCVLFCVKLPTWSQKSQSLLGWCGLNSAAATQRTDLWPWWTHRRVETPLDTRDHNFRMRRRFHQLTSTWIQRELRFSYWQHGKFDVCVCVCKNCHLLFKPQIYLLPIKEQALFWELTGNVTRTAFT